MDWQDVSLPEKRKSISTLVALPSASLLEGHGQPPKIDYKLFTSAVLSAYQHFIDFS